MTSREEKLAAARRKLRQFQGKTRDSDSQVSAKEVLREGSAASSPSPKFYQHENIPPPRPESPLDAARLAWERRQTIEISEAHAKEQLHHELNSHPSLDQLRRQSETNVIMENWPEEQERAREQLEWQQMRDQLQRQAQAITVLVSERTDAHTNLSRVQSELHQKSDAFEDVKNKYLEANRRVSELENAPQRHISTIQNSQAEEELRRCQEGAHHQISMLQDQLSELRSRLDAKNHENEALLVKTGSLENSLSVAQVRIQQLTTEESPASNAREKDLDEENQALKKEVELLGRRLQAAAMEGEQAAHRFQVYADQCSSQQAALRTQLRDVVEENKTLAAQCTESLQAIEAFQNRIQQAKEEESPLEARLGALTVENTSFTQCLQEKDAEIGNLRAALAETEEKLAVSISSLNTAHENMRRLEARADGGRPDPALLAAMESDKVAASRAVAQNQKLKSQLTELQEAFVRLCDEKLALTEKVSNAEYLAMQLQKEITSHDHSHHDGHGHSHDHDHDHDSDEEEAEWDEAMLRSVVAALRRDKTELVMRLQQLQSNGERSPSAHSHSHAHFHQHSHNHQSEEDCHDHEQSERSSEKLAEEVAELRRAVEQLQVDKAELLKRLGGPIEDPQVQGLLETKLRRTMDEIAVLDEEKQRLEHLVLQLQGETETIGEYIALYHKQRLVLRQRCVEKDDQLTQLSKDREELKEKLLSLNELVAKLVGEGAKPEVQGAVDEKLEEMTAQRIRALITEIGNNNVVNAHSVAFEQCSCCSGRLITV